MDLTGAFRSPTSKLSGFKNNDIVENFIKSMRLMLSETTTKIYLSFIGFIIFLGLFGPTLAPYEANELIRGEDGQLLRAAPPSLEHPLGTTSQGYDVLSQILIGSQPSVLAGILGGIMIITIGLTVGLTSGYVGGRVDDILMRITDLVYSTPIIPLALVLITIIGIGYFQAVFVIGIILWRGSARVIRSQVLQIRERPYVLSAQATGASTPYIILRHILPNVAPMAVLFFALGTGFTIVAMAGLSFLGVVDPFIPSWGVILRNAYNSGYAADAWWWSIPAGFLIALTVLSLFMVGRGYERIANPEQDHGDEAIAHGAGGV